MRKLSFYNSLFEYDGIAFINKPTRVAKKSATRIDSVIAANIFDDSLKKRHNKIRSLRPIRTSKSPQNSSSLKRKKESSFFQMSDEQP